MHNARHRPLSCTINPSRAQWCYDAETMRQRPQDAGISDLHVVVYERSSWVVNRYPPHGRAISGRFGEQVRRLLWCIGESATLALFADIPFLCQGSPQSHRSTPHRLQPNVANLGFGTSADQFRLADFAHLNLHHGGGLQNQHGKSAHPLARWHVRREC